MAIGRERPLTLPCTVYGVCMQGRRGEAGGLLQEVLREVQERRAEEQRLPIDFRIQVTSP